MLNRSKTKTCTTSATLAFTFFVERGLIQRAKDELGSMVAEAQKERMLTKAEVKNIFGVCDTTLWNWQNKGILKPVKTGNKVLYHESEVRKALGMRNVKF